ncbi:MAG TPA: type IV secretion protein IcmT [Rhodospirillaceae bacterium]|mgnify:CR=1 FL=1|jgi:hypothetical protein|nr:IcmT/TraK family protein [Alphaproteobacteria bacterium]HBH26321.1 type IV secretion protein IcmT [Rhodospirillaceae bacterium]
MSKELEILEERSLWHWRDSMRVVRFFGFDARLSVLVPLVLLKPFWVVTWVIVAAMMGAFYTMERYGLTFPAALRALRVWFLGRLRPGLLPHRHRRFSDYGAQ